MKEHLRRHKFTDDENVTCIANGWLWLTSELRRNAGTIAYQLQETVLKSDKIWCISDVANCVSLATSTNFMLHAAKYT